ncbi:MAG: glycosyltransferase [Anaerolineales bacterium]|nr:glycosyltransferase [Anaerolineales bacterium]
MSWLPWVYVAALVVMSVYGLNMLLMTALSAGLWLAARRRPLTRPRAARDWPTVLVQLPLYNERYVVERLIDAAAAMDYPPDRLHIQVLDDSTDDTAALARARVAYHRARGLTITYQHRQRRSDYKAGALAAGLLAAESELVAIFDADFVPGCDFLRRTVPVVQADPRLALVQTRWEHLNADYDMLTRAEALALDAYFGGEQFVRSRLGLLMNFNGSGGVWRRAAIEDAGGWQGDTLAEDLDLSYRAQLRGWRLVYLPGVTAPAELPTSITAFKRQQFRWAKGSFQVLRKLGGQLLAAPISPVRKLEGLLHLTGYLPHALMVVTLVLSLPVVLLFHGQTAMHWSVLGAAGFGPILLGVVAQAGLRRDWPRRVIYYPALILVGIGLALTSAHAAWQAFFGPASEFLRTPKTPPGPGASAYAMPLDWTTWGESFLAFYALVTGMLALELAPALAPMAFIYVLGFGATAALGFWQSDHLRQRKAARQTAR